MALLTTWGKANRLVSSGLSVKYRQERVRDRTLPYWKLTRYARKSYEYIGMTEAAARACAAAMTAIYTRRYFTEPYLKAIGVNLYDWFTDDVYECQADINPHPIAGDDWGVSIDINETDYQVARAVVQDPALRFPVQNSRDYEEDGALRLTRAVRSNITVYFDFAHDIEDFDESKIGIRYKESETALYWTTVPGSRVHIADRQWVGAPSAELAPTLIMELTYDGEAITSNAFTVTETEENQ